MIQVENLRKEFKKTIKEPGLKGSFKSLFKPKTERVVAVDDISFEVPKGEILGFIGPNGAGKSTVIKMLTGILTPTSGRCTINGKNPTVNRKSYVKEIGVVFGQRTQLWWDLPLRETYGVLKEIYEVDEKSYRERMAFLNETLDLESFISSPVRTLSLGQRMRADIAASLLHSPKVLFLDEPTIGLDVVVKDNIRRAIEQINRQEQTTVILTTHDLADIELLADRIVMIDKGKNVFDGSVGELKTRYGQMRELNFVTDSTDPESALSYREHFSLDSEDVSVKREGSSVKVRFNSEAVAVSDILAYTLATVRVNDISVKDADIEEIIRRLYKQGVD
ncbi:MAG: ATP-binding cassette domain-containing protein [Ruminococcus sp.]|uniref:ABC transporter ATP-binding protein n=1 Tax=uncultured Ruminococcus sp. TaxID=165186 RepID=UPI00164C30AC|nr:ATP-binding cassette domain-containing protein [uncultured Ruminococcus sp.]MBQ1353950.1 ATP-binding cassette domain-containing protein [Ruminococcus sp.]MBQ1586701.1 ATP-binding cassette domain-containing protein [Ruminococcus sp.]MBQ1830013.1 ATP-binding cassette domain-containing protein [Ruminococcus sp.]MBQ2280992.1 ATP-binding cassette domain-containing protein [Ruminococcus sp.]MBQ2537454.1 ATP-binding cassette domain-containing protein [Ruminococcus sp.]